MGVGMTDVWPGATDVLRVRDGGWDDREFWRVEATPVVFRVASVDSVSVVVTVPKLKPRGGLFGRSGFLCLLRTV